MIWKKGECTGEIESDCAPPYWFKHRKVLQRQMISLDDKNNSLTLFLRSKKNHIPLSTPFQVCSSLDSHFKDHIMAFTLCVDKARHPWAVTMSSEMDRWTCTQVWDLRAMETPRIIVLSTENALGCHTACDRPPPRSWAIVQYCVHRRAISGTVVMCAGN